MNRILILTMSVARRPLAFWAGLLLASAAWAAEPLPQPQGPVLLTVTGQISVDGGAAEFDREMLESLGMTEIETRTIWTRGKHVFTGPTVASLMERVGAEGTLVEAGALNDYVARIPMSDLTPDGPILALDMDGTPMPVRRKGPIWIIYPYDADPAYRADAIYMRSVWQLRTLNIIE